ncbi:MAG TPA: NAD(P)H-hydrate dehydratase [Terriglobales bacterium]|nr:NAD(P)H-hydrate dehydratase [Terriglobales bacterium]
MKIVSAAEMREIDRVSSERFGVPSLTLMENAGTAVSDFVFSHYPNANTIGIICGKGNNGGDGFVAARKLYEAGKPVRLLLLAEEGEIRGDAAAMFKKLPVTAVTARSREELNSDKARAVFSADVLIDAILGTGFRPPVSGIYGEAIALLNAASAPVVAVDIPSGADADVMGSQTGAVARADAIVTFTAPRPAHVFGMLTTGPLVVAPIGSPDAAITSSLNLEIITAKDVLPLLAPRRPDANKGNFGHALVIGGSIGKAGAAAMAGMSALRVGAGLSTVATPKSVLPTVAGFHPEIMTEPLAETEAGTISLRAMEYGNVDELVKGKTVLAIGPGISRNVETAEFVHAIAGRCKLPMVIDADGLNAFENCADRLHGRDHPLVITPHPGEMARLCGCSVPQIQHDRINTARTFASEHQCIVVLKGHRTLVANPEGQVWVNVTGNPGMASGGTGDILTGMVAGFIAQNLTDIFRATLGAVYLHGLAGDLARDAMGEQCLTATDLIKALPEAFRRARDSGTRAGSEAAQWG